MIAKNEEQVILEFGSGDICIAGGYSKNEDKNRVCDIYKPRAERNRDCGGYKVGGS